MLPVHALGQTSLEVLEAMISSVAGSPAGSRVTAGSGSPSAVGSGNCSMHQDDGWLVSGGGVGLAGSSPVRHTVNGNPKTASTHSTYSAKLPRGPFMGRHAFNCSLIEDA